jgi:hypothetical protein
MTKALPKGVPRFILSDLLKAEIYEAPSDLVEDAGAGIGLGRTGQTGTR